MTLFLDTTDYNAIHFALTDGKTLREQKHQLKYNENDKTLLLLDKFLKKHQASFQLTSSALRAPSPLQEKVKTKAPLLKRRGAGVRFDRILVCTGPGSFTGTRVGVTIALALRLALDIKVGGIKKPQIPNDLRKLTKLKGSSELKVSYNRPAL